MLMNFFTICGKDKFLWDASSPDSYLKPGLTQGLIDATNREAKFTPTSFIFLYLNWTYGSNHQGFALCITGFVKLYLYMFSFYGSDATI